MVATHGIYVTNFNLSIDRDNKDRGVLYYPNYPVWAPHGI